MKTFPKTYLSNLDYEWDWRPWLGTDEILNVTLEATGNITIGSYVEDQGIVKAWLNSSDDDVLGIVTCFVETVGGRKDSRAIRFDIGVR